MTRPQTPMRPCSWPGCRALVPLSEFRCAKHAADRSDERARGRRVDAKRRGGQPWRGWYNLARWRNPVWGARARRLAASPLCVFCLQRGVTRLATVVDHIIPHRGDWAAVLGR